MQGPGPQQDDRAHLLVAALVAGRVGVGPQPVEAREATAALHRHGVPANRCHRSRPQATSAAPMTTDSVCMTKLPTYRTMGHAAEVAAG